MLNLTLIFLYLIPSIVVLQKSGSFLNPAFLISLSGVPFFVMNLVVSPAVLELNGTEGFKYAQYMLLINLSLSGLVFVVFFRSKQLNRIVSRLLSARQYSLSQKGLIRLSNLFFALYIIFFLILGSRSGGVNEWIFNSRHTYITGRTGNGLFYALTINFLLFSYYLRLLSTRNFYIIFLFTFLVYFPLVNFLGSKGPIIAMLISMGAYTAYFNVRAFILLLFLSPFFLIPFLYFSFYSESLFSLLISIGRYFDYYTNASIYYEDYLSGRHRLYDGEIFLTSLWSYVPRALVNAKPTIYGILHIVDYYYPGGPASGNTPAFGALVFEHADFGILGVIIFSVLSFGPIYQAFVYSYMLKFFDSKEVKFTVQNVLVLAFGLSPYFAVYFSGVMWALFVLMLLFILIIGRQLRTLLGVSL